VAFGIINLVQSRAQDLQNQADMLGMTIGDAINTYSGLPI
jgi:hypothetical protein